jgi:hypothetical protein
LSGLQILNATIKKFVLVAEGIDEPFAQTVVQVNMTAMKHPSKPHALAPFTTDGRTVYRWCDGVSMQVLDSMSLCINSNVAAFRTNCTVGATLDSLASAAVATPSMLLHDHSLRLHFRGATSFHTNVL